MSNFNNFSSYDLRFVKIQNSKKDYEQVLKKTKNKLLQLPDGHFPTERINNMSDIFNISNCNWNK